MQNEDEPSEKNQNQEKMKLYTLGEEPFDINPEDEEADFISCRIGSILEKTLKC